MSVGGSSFGNGDRRLGITVMLLLLLLLAGGWIAARAALGANGTGRRAKVETEQSLSSPSQGAREIASKRTKTSDTYMLPNGRRETRIYEAPINYRNSDGEWRPIREGFRRNGLAIEDRGHPFAIHLPSQMGNGAVRVGEPRHWISFELAGPESSPADLAADGTVSYEVPSSQTDLEYATLPDGLKETIELAQPSAPASIHYQLSMAAGITPELGKDGGVVFRDESNRAVAVMPAPTVSDSSSSAAYPEPGQVAYSLTPRQDGEWNLAVEVDRNWLAAPERVWPVRIDPSLQTANAGAMMACALDSNFPRRNDCRANELFPTPALIAAERVSGSERHLAHSVFKFDLSTIPAGAEVTEASVGLYSPSETNAKGLDLRRVVTPWDETANWNCASRFESLHPACKVSWTTSGGDFNAEGSELLSSVRGTQSGWWVFSKGLASVFQGWLAGNLNAGLLVKLHNDGQECPAGAESCVVQWLGEWPTTPDPSKRPYATVVYLPKAPPTSKLVFPTEGTRTARRLKLKAKWGEEGSVSGVTFEYRLGKEQSDRFEPIPLELIRKANGEPVKEWPIPVSKTFETEPFFFDAAHAAQQLRKEGGPVYVRATFDGSLGMQGFSEPVEAAINRVTGSPHDATAEVGPGTLDLETGNLSISRTDVSIPGFNSALEFSRTYNSKAPSAVTQSERKEPPSVLGPGWKTGIPVEEAGGSEFRNVRMVVEEGSYEEEVGEACHEVGEEEVCEPEIVQVPYRFAYAVVTLDEGGEMAFEEGPNATFITPPELTGWSLVHNGATFVLSDPYGDVTTFSNEQTGGGSEYMPESINQPGGPGNSTRLVWRFKNNEKQLVKLIAPSPPGLSCVNVTALEPIGCHALEFAYSPVGEKGERLMAITYLAPGNGGSFEVAHYEYNSAGRLTAEWDPRISPALKEQYNYGANEQLNGVKLPGQKPWKLEYSTVDEEAGVGRLTKVKRASLLSSPTEATTTIAYEVPLSGSSAPYDLGGKAISQWGQQDVPVEATAIFPPSEVPSSSPPSSWAQATIYYMDSEGYAVNTATPKGGGTSEPSISVAEPDEYGNIVRELTPKNRLAVLAKPEAERKATWEALESHRRYTEEGTQMVEEWGPTHPVRIAETGEPVEARLHKTVEYDQCQPGECWSGIKPHLPTRVTTGASNPSWGKDKDQRVTETRYKWSLRKPTETVVDPGTGHLNIKNVTAYDLATGLPIETRQPGSAEQPGSAGTTRVSYYEAGEVGGGCILTPRYAGLPCSVGPGSQAEGAGRPKLLVKTYAAYNALGEPTEVLERPGGEAGNTRKTITTYDAAGRQLSQRIEGGGTPVPKTETLYSPTLGLPEKQRFVCEGECTTAAPKYVSAMGEAGSGSGQLNGPRGVAADGKGHIWVVDRLDNRIAEFSESGGFVEAIGWGVANGESKLEVCTSSCQVGISGSGDGQFSTPWGIAVDAKGNIWVADSGNARIQELSAEGKFLQKFGIKAFGSSRETEFVRPDGVAIAPNGMLWVTDNGGPRVAEFRRTVSKESERFVRNVKGTLPAGTGPEGVAVDAHGNVWVTLEEPTSQVLEYDPEGNLIRTVGSVGTGNGQFRAPSGIAVAPSGNILVSDTNNNRIEEFSPEGAFLRSFGTGSGGESFSEPKGIAISSGSVAFIADKNRNQIKKWNLEAGFDSQATTVAYDELGRPVEYEDADGNVSETTYDVDGRPVTTTDSKGSQTITYDSTSGLPTKLEDSAAGTFTASYDADGNIKTRTLPDGLTATTTYNAVDEPTGLSYTKETNCGASCTWLEENVGRSVYGQMLDNSGNLVNDSYFYDKAGRLTEARETPSGGSCTARAYTYDADSNRLSMVTRAPGIGGACQTTGGTEQKYSYDKADRLEGPTYDAWGRITSLPAEFAGGKALETSYYSTDMVAIQTQGGITNSYNLDATGRQRSRLQGGGGLEGTEIFHYDGPTDSVAWTERGSTWTRNIAGIGGELAATQESGSGVTLQLTSIHGDVIATAEPSPTATKLKATFRFDEFGNPLSGSAGRFGWLGGKQRRTELPAGVIQMGRRSYIPALGRFLTPDPVPGGSANAYDYAHQDPLNEFDLEGTCSTKKNCAAARHKAQARGTRRIKRVRSIMQEAREARAKRASASTTHVGPIAISVPWEKQVEGVLHTAESALGGIFHESCEDASGALGAAGFTSSVLGKVLGEVGGPYAKAAGGALGGLGWLLGAAATGLYAGSKLGIC